MDTQFRVRFIVTLLLLNTVAILVTFSINNAAVEARKRIARTPPMGWITWERFTCQIDCQRWPNDCINSELIMATADRIKVDGFSDAGYNYVNIDDCWSNMERHPETQKLVPDEQRFGGSEGILRLSNYVHDRGLYLGIYGDCGTKTCAGYPGQLKSSEVDLEDNYFELDANTLDEWKIDSFKFDGCNIDPFKAESICPKMANFIKNAQRPILLTCEWPFYMLRELPNAKVNWTLATESCNVIRYFEDVEDSWMSILSIIDFSVKMQKTIVEHHGLGHWFDPDQLVIGNFGLSRLQAEAQMAIWSIWSAPLFMSNDLRHIEPEMADILKNKHLISVNQDYLGVFGLMVAEVTNDWNSKFQAFVKPMMPIVNECPSFAIVYLNREVLGNGHMISFKLRDLLEKSPIEIAARRYDQLDQDYKKPGQTFSKDGCIKRLTNAMKSDPNLIKTSELLQREHGQESPVNLEDEPVNYNVLDLIQKRKLGKVALNANLDLVTLPSGVRAVVLTESSQLFIGEITYNFV